MPSTTQESMLVREQDSQKIVHLKCDCSHFLHPAELPLWWRQHTSAKQGLYANHTCTTMLA